MHNILTDTLLPLGYTNKKRTNGIKQVPLLGEGKVRSKVVFLLVATVVTYPHFIHMNKSTRQAVPDAMNYTDRTCSAASGCMFNCDKKKCCKKYKRGKLPCKKCPKH